MHSRPRATPRPGPALDRLATCRGRDFPWLARRRTDPSPDRPVLAGWRQPAWAHRGGAGCPEAHPFAEHDIHLQPACHGEPECRRRATAGADELRCHTSHLAAVQKPPAHRIIVSEHARGSVPGTAILLVQANGERGNASAQRRRSGASGEYTQHARRSPKLARNTKQRHTEQRQHEAHLGNTEQRPRILSPPLVYYNRSSARKCPPPKHSSWWGARAELHKKALDGYGILVPRSGTTSWPRRGLRGRTARVARRQM